MRAKVVFALTLLLEGDIVSLAATHKPLVSELGFQLRPLALQLRVETGHDGLLCRHTCVYGHLGDVGDIQLTLEGRSSGATLCLPKLAHTRLHAANAACVQTLKV